MTTQTQFKCLRCREDCTPASNIMSDDEGNSFICVGWNSPKGRPIPQDRFTLCWKNAQVDTMDYLDKRDLIDTMSTIAQALSIDENIRVGEGSMTEEDMQEVDMLV